MLFKNEPGTEVAVFPHMPRKIVTRQNIGPYHVSCRRVNKEYFKIPMEQVWQIFSEQLYFAKFAFDLQIHSFVLMNNHYHLLISTPKCNLSQAMAYFQRETSRELNRASQCINQNFGCRYHPCYLGSYHYFMNTYKYIYQNPLRAGLVKRVEDYPYSTLHGLLGHSHLMIPVSEDTILFDGSPFDTLKWLNDLPTQTNVEAIRFALRRQVFKLRSDPKSRRKHSLEVALL